MTKLTSELQLAEERFSLLVDGVRDYAIFMLDPEGNISTWNTGAERITGYKGKEVVGKNFRMLYPPDLLAANHPENELKIAREVGRFEEEGRRQRKDGSVFWVHVILTALFSDDGTLRGFAKITRDITERKIAAEKLRKAHEELEKRVEERTAALASTVAKLQQEIAERKRIEKELIKAKDAADEASRAKSVFLANVSHEIRTPLNSILGFSNLLSRGEPSGTDLIQLREAIERNGNLLVTIINDILDLSKIEAGKFEVNKEEIDFTNLLIDVGEVLTLQAQAKGLAFSIETEGQIPKKIHTDPVRLKQVLINVIGNALKYTERGSVRVTVKEKMDKARSTLVFVVKDTGIGISPEGAAKLFLPFSQMDSSSTRTYSGTGLGLALSRRLAQSLGGDVVLEESEVGRGSTFVVTIESEAKKTLFFSPGMRREPAREEAKAVSLSGARVLLVEDVTDNRTLATLFLKGAGAEVVPAAHGQEGVELALSQNFDVVLMDIQMPVMDGYEATSLLRERNYTKPIIALTAHAMTGERQRCLDRGFDDYISKPLDGKKLLETVKKYAF